MPLFILGKIKKKLDMYEQHPYHGNKIHANRWNKNSRDKYLLKVFQHNITKCLRLVQVRLWSEYVRIMENIKT